MNDQAVLDSQNDAEMIKRPHLWPHVLLPLERRGEDDHPGSFPQTGYLEYPGTPCIVVLGTIWGGPEGGTLEYDSPEAVVADGWRVD